MTLCGRLVRERKRKRESVCTMCVGLCARGALVSERFDGKCEIKMD